MTKYLTKCASLDFLKPKMYLNLHLPSILKKKKKNLKILGKLKITSLEFGGI